MTSEEFQALIDQETDPFRLAILGNAALEATLNDAIARSFLRPPPADILSMAYDRRLTLGVALGVVTEEQLPLFKLVARIRHDFAHNTIQSLDFQRAKGLLEHVAPTLLSEDNRKALEETRDPVLLLRIALAYAQFSILANLRDLEATREKERQIVETFGQRRPPWATTSSLMPPQA
jgi:hypothetical protein